MEIKNCPFCGCRPTVHLGKLTGCQIHGDPRQGIVIACKWEKCPAKPSIEAGDIYNGDDFPKYKEQATIEAVNVWNTRHE